MCTYEATYHIFYLYEGQRVRDLNEPNKTLCKYNNIVLVIQLFNSRGKVHLMFKKKKRFFPALAVFFGGLQILGFHLNNRWN